MAKKAPGSKTMPKKGDPKKNGPIKTIKSDRHLGTKKTPPKEPKHEAFDHHTTPSQKPNMSMPAARGSIKAYRKKK